MSDVQATTAGLPSYPGEPKLDVGATVSTAWRVFRLQPWRYVAFLLLPIPIVLPFSILSEILKSTQEGGSGIAIASVILTALVQYCSLFVCQLAALRGASLNIAGGRFRIGDMLWVGLRRFLPYLGLAILSIIIIFVGALLLVIPAFIAIIYLVAAGAACVIEERGPIASIQRSVGLISGNWWRTFAVLLLAVLLPILGLVAVAGALVGLFIALDVKWLSLILILPVVPIYFSIVAVGTILPAVIFMQLRALKEGGGPGGVAGVF